MCAPVIGLLSVATGVMGAMGQHQQAQASADYQNKVNQQNFEQQKIQQALKITDRDNDWQNRRQNYGKTIGENRYAAGRGYAKAQLAYTEKLSQSVAANQGDLMTLLGAKGEAAVSGRTGKSANRIDAAMVQQYGRNQAMRSASLASSRHGALQNMEDIRLQQISADRKAFEEVALRPTNEAPLAAPVQAPGPSGLGLAAGIAGAALDGYGAFKAAQPPSGGNIPQPQPIGNVGTGYSGGTGVGLSSGNWASNWGGLV